MHVWIIRKLPILLSIIVLQVLFLTPSGRVEDFADTKLTICINVKPVSGLEINKAMIEKILAEYIGHLRGIALRSYAKQRVAQFRLTNVEGRTYTEVMPLED